MSYNLRKRARIIFRWGRVGIPLDVIVTLGTRRFLPFFTFSFLLIGLVFALTEPIDETRKRGQLNHVL